MQRQRDDPVAGQPPPTQISRDLLAHLGQRGRLVQRAVELLFVPFLLPILVVEVLASAGGISTVKSLGIGDRCTVRIEVAEPAAPANPTQSGPRTSLRRSRMFGA